MFHLGIAIIWFVFFIVTLLLHKQINNLFVIVAIANLSLLNFQLWWSEKETKKLKSQLKQMEDK